VVIGSGSGPLVCRLRATVKSLRNARPILFYARGATCRQPYVKGFSRMANSLFNGWRMGDSPGCRRAAGNPEADKLIVSNGVDKGLSVDIDLLELVDQQRLAG
jgi:hypothetical protein